MDHLGNPVYKKAKGGELKRTKMAICFKSRWGKKRKYLHLRLCPIIFRTAPYIKGEAKPEDLSNGMKTWFLIM